MMKYFLVCGICVLSLGLGAQTRFESLQQVLDYADEHASSIRSARLQEAANTSKEKQAKFALLPTLNSSAGLTNNLTIPPTLVPAQLFTPGAPEGQIAELTFGRQYVYTLAAQANWVLLDFQRRAARQTAAAQSELGQVQTLKASFDLYNQLANTYYSQLLAQTYRGLSEENLATADSILRSTQLKYEQGLLGEEGLNRARIQQLQAAQDLTQARAQLDQLQLQLQMLLGIEEEIFLAESLSLQPAAQLPAPTPAPHPDVLIAEAQVDLAAKQLQKSRSMFLPTLGGSYQYAYTWATDGLTDFAEGNSFPQQALTLRLNIPIFNGLQVREQSQQAQIALKQQELQLAHALNSTQKQDEILESQRRQYEQALLQTTQILELQTANDGHAAQQYAQGLISLDERLNRLQDLLAVQTQYLQSVSDYYLNYYQRYIRQLSL